MSSFSDATFQNWSSNMNAGVFLKEGAELSRLRCFSMGIISYELGDLSLENYS